MGEAKRRREKSPKSVGKAIVIKIEKSKMTGKWLVVAYILRQRYVISPFVELANAERALIQVETIFNSIDYERWRTLRRGDRTVLIEAMSKLSYDDDDEVVGLFNMETGEIISKKQNSQLIQDATEWANYKATLQTGKPMFSQK